MFVITKDWFRTTQRQQQAFQSGVTQTKGNRGPEHKHRRISPITWLTLREQVSWLRASSPLSPFLPPPAVPAPKGNALPDPLDTRPQQGSGGADPRSWGQKLSPEFRMRPAHQSPPSFWSLCFL